MRGVCLARSCSNPVDVVADDAEYDGSTQDLQLVPTDGATAWSGRFCVSDMSDVWVAEQGQLKPRRSCGISRS